MCMTIDNFFARWIMYHPFVTYISTKLHHHTTILPIDFQNRNIQPKKIQSDFIWNCWNYINQVWTGNSRHRTEVKRDSVKCWKLLSSVNFPWFQIHWPNTSSRYLRAYLTLMHFPLSEVDQPLSWPAYCRSTVGLTSKRDKSRIIVALWAQIDYWSIVHQNSAFVDTHATLLTNPNWALFRSTQLIINTLESQILHLKSIYDSFIPYFANKCQLAVANHLVKR